MKSLRSALARMGILDEPEVARTAMVLSGGGARAAYQAGVLCYVADSFPEAAFPLITGVSAGAINAAQLASSPEAFGGAAGYLADSWTDISPDDVFDTPSRLQFLWRTFAGDRDGGQGEILPKAGLVDTAPLRRFLMRKLGTSDGSIPGIAENIASGDLRAIALLTTSYTTAQTVGWVQGSSMSRWEKPNRVAREVELHVDHIMASSSLPFLFPAINLGNAWHGDGGIRLSDPLSPAIHLGANRILAISTRYHRSRGEAGEPVTEGYPPSAQIFGVLMNAVFLDRLDQDASILRRTNRLLKRTPRRYWNALRPIRLLLMRPSVDIGRLSADFEHDLSGVLDYLAKALGSSDTKSPDWLSMILFDPRYTERLLEVGYQDARNRRDDLERFFSPTA